jgi:FkbM family methyltransferase
MKKILIAIPTNKNIESETFKSIYDLIIPDGHETQLEFFYGYQIDQIRNLIAEWGKRYDYLFCVDSDIILPNDCLQKFIVADKDIVSGLYIQRKPNEHTLELYWKTNMGYENVKIDQILGYGLINVGACGFGCVLIKSDVLRKMEYPHFVYKSALDHAHTFSEDIYFCQKATELGFTVWVDESVKCEHIGSTKYIVNSNVVPHENFEAQVKAVYKDLAQRNDIPVEHQKYLEDLRYLKKIKPKVIYDIGSCVLNWTNFAKKLWPTADIYQFEAMDLIEELYEEYGIKNYAHVLLTDVDNKSVSFYQNLLLPGGNSYYKENTQAFNESHRVTKIGMTLDTIVKNNNWPLPSMIKMDTQGSEIDILKGAKNSLSECYDLIIEAQHTDYNLGAPKVEEVINYVQSIGFVLVREMTHGPIDRDYHFKRYR